jgi:hypothetical protein
MNKRAVAVRSLARLRRNSPMTAAFSSFRRVGWIDQLGVAGKDFWPLDPLRPNGAADRVV